MMEAFRQNLVRVQPGDAEEGEAIRKGPIEKGGLLDRQSKLRLQLHVPDAPAEGSRALTYLFDRSPLGHLPLNVLAPNLRDRREPLAGQQVDERSLAAAGSTRDHLPLRLAPEGGGQKIGVQLRSSKAVLGMIKHVAIPSPAYKTEGARCSRQQRLLSIPRSVPQAHDLTACIILDKWRLGKPSRQSQSRDMDGTLA